MTLTFQTLRETIVRDWTLTHSGIRTAHISYANEFSGLGPRYGYLKHGCFQAGCLQTGVQYVIIRWSPVRVRYTI